MIDYGFIAKCNHCNGQFIMYYNIQGQATMCPYCSYYVTTTVFTRDILHIYPPTWKEVVNRLPYYEGTLL